MRRSGERSSGLKLTEKYGDEHSVREHQRQDDHVVVRTQCESSEPSGYESQGHGQSRSQDQNDTARDDGGRLVIIPVGLLSGELARAEATGHGEGAVVSQ